MQSFKPLWACRPDYLSPMAKALAADEYIGPDDPMIMAGRAKRFAIIDSLPAECRAWIHENGSANLLRNWQRGERNAKRLIREGEKWLLPAKALSLRLSK